MNKKGYEAKLCADRSIYGVELDIRVPGNDNPVVVAQDVYGEKEELWMEIFSHIRFVLARMPVPNSSIQEWLIVLSQDFSIRRQPTIGRSLQVMGKPMYLVLNGSSQLHQELPRLHTSQLAG